MAIPGVNQRIKEIIDRETGGSPSLFADKIGINRATISNIINGRNDKDGKSYYPLPPTDVLQKIMEVYENINSEWILSGKYSMYKMKEPSFFDESYINPVNDAPVKKYSTENEVKEVKKELEKIINQEIIPIKSNSKKIDQIVVFYSDKTYESFHPDK
jgi:hypothetical protein